MDRNKKELFCPNCHGVEFVEEAECAAVNRDFRVPEDPEEPITYGHEYSQGDIESLRYTCRKCGLRFNSQDEEEFRQELKMYDDLLDGEPVWFVRDGEVYQGTCKKLNESLDIWVQPSEAIGGFWEPNPHALCKTREAAEERLRASFEYRVQELQKKIAEEKAAWKDLEKQLERIEEKLNKED